MDNGAKCEILQGGGHPGEHECGAEVIGQTYDGVAICRSCAQGFVDNQDEDLLSLGVLRVLGVSDEKITAVAAEQKALAERLARRI